MTIAYRSFRDLARCIVDNAWRVPKDVDLIVGVARSGMVPATILSQLLELPLVDFEGYLAGRAFKSGRRVQGATTGRNALIVDDSIATGAANAILREQLVSQMPNAQYRLAAIYADSSSKHLVDLYCEELSGARIFEWNMSNHYLLGSTCVDIDGVLCRDPLPDENDDGERYLGFVATVEPKIRFRRKIGWLVTSRLERYRSQTVEWLKRQGVEYGELIMLDLPSKQVRLESGAHQTYKANVYARLPANLFIESEGWQADNIARRSGKPVLCVDESRLALPAQMDKVVAKARSLPARVLNRIRRYLRRNNVSL